MHLPIGLADHEHPGQSPRAFFQPLTLVGFWVEVILESLRCVVIEGAAIALFVGLHRKDTQVLAHNVHAGDSPCFEAKVLVPPNEEIQQLCPGLKDLGPHQRRRLQLESAFSNEHHGMKWRSCWGK